MHWNDQTSAMKKHYLSSILPFQNISGKFNQITKSKDFYQPDKFIWNNPHRTCKKIFTYYHQNNETFLKDINPKISELEENDRRTVQEDRIIKLSQKRNQMRRKLQRKQKERQILESKCGLRKKQYSVEGRKKIETNQITEYEQFQKKNSLKSAKVRYSTSIINPHNHHKMLAPEKTFLKSVQSYDKETNNMQKLASDQFAKIHHNIREQFEKRRQTNGKKSIIRKRNSVLIRSKNI